MTIHLLALSFFCVAVLDSYEMTILTIKDDRLYDDKLVMTRDLAIIFLLISICLSAVSYGA